LRQLTSIDRDDAVWHGPSPIAFFPGNSEWRKGPTALQNSLNIKEIPL
jgi:hypothetical protein